MPNDKRQITEDTDPKVAQAIIGERLNEMSRDIKDVQRELKESREPLAVVKFLIAGFWAVLAISITALIKVFTFIRVSTFN